MNNKELKKLCNKLPGLDPNWQPDNYQKILENSFKKTKDEQNRIILYDPVRKKNRNYSECRKNYGKVFTNRLLSAKEHNNGQLEKSIYIKLMKEYSNEKIQFVGTKFPAIDNEELWKKVCKYIGIYIYMRRNVVRGVLRNDKSNVYENYFKNGLLAYAGTKRHLGKANGIDKDTAAAHINKLIDLGIIEIKHSDGIIKRSAKGLYISECDIYILGSIEKGKEHYFIDMI